jgi:RNA polymerase sigma-70 factor (ECF subfamily)
MGEAAADSDRVLVERILAGDAAAFAAIVDRFCAPMTRLAQIILGDSTHVPDALQETWIAVLAALPGFEWRASL